MIIPNSRRIPISCTVAVLVIFCVAIFGAPIFETNDDVALAMMGAGFGMAVEPEPHLIFAPYGYGLLLNVLSMVVGPNAHGYMTLASVGFSLGLISYLLSARLDWLVSGLLLVLGCIFLGAFLTPQYTTTAGLLTAAGIGAYKLLAQYTAMRLPALSVVYIAIFLGMLIRPASAFSVFIVAFPALTWLSFFGSAIEKWRMRRFIASYVVIAFTFTVIEWAAYYFSQPWYDALQYNFVRALFIDFERIPWDPSAPIYEAVGWSYNDYLMFKSWFFLHTIYDIEKISAIASAFAPTLISFDIKLTFKWFSKLTTDPQSIALIISQTVMIVAFRKSRLMILLHMLGFALAILLVSLTGRQPQPRVFMTLASASVLFSYICMVAHQGTAAISFPQRTALVVLAIVGSVCGIHIVREHYARTVDASNYRFSLAAASSHLSGRVVIWAGNLRLQWLVTPTEIFWPFPELQVIGLGASSRFPVVIKTLDRWGVRDFGREICTSSEFKIVATDVLMARLETFCDEHYKTRPEYRLVYKAGRTQIYARDTSKP